MTMSIILEGENVCKSFGSFDAVDEVNFQVKKGEIFGIAGPNGGGKTVLFNIITKIPYPPSSGRIYFDGEDITKLPAYKISKRGLARTFQVPIVFEDLTMLENVVLGVAFGGERDRISLMGGKDKDSSEAMRILEFLGVKEKSDIPGSSLPLIDKKMTMIASALATRPKALMLDEPIAGLNPSEIDLMMDTIRRINESGVTIVVIEHVMRALVGLSNRMMILVHGKKIVEGKPEKVVEDERVIEAYLGSRKVTTSRV